MTSAERRSAVVRMFGSAVVMQALLSAANFLVGLFLIRHVSNTDYGYFVLVTNGALLLSTTQTAFIQPPMVMRLIHSDTAARADLVGGLHRAQRRILLLVLGLAVVLVATAWLLGIIANHDGILAMATIVLFGASLYREFFRMVLLSYKRSQDVLKADAVYVVLLVIGVPAATMTPLPAPFAVLAAGFSALVGGSLVALYLRRHEPWNPRAPASVLREMAPLGKWSAMGAGTHWAFSQGYNFVVAGQLEVAAVASLAATRLLMMPVNLLSSGIGAQMMPASSEWLHKHGATMLFRRLLAIASVLGLLTLFYSIAIWLLRGWIFTEILHKQFAQSGALVAIWSAVFLVMIFRDQLQFLPGATGLYRPLMAVTGTSALISLCVGFFSIGHMGVIGAPIGVLVGELCNLLGIVFLSLRQIWHQGTGDSRQPSH